MMPKNMDIVFAYFFYEDFGSNNFWVGSTEGSDYSQLTWLDGSYIFQIPFCQSLSPASAINSNAAVYSDGCLDISDVTEKQFYVCQYNV
jgi:hypothetical protein